MSYLSSITDTGVTVTVTQEPAVSVAWEFDVRRFSDHVPVTSPVSGTAAEMGVPIAVSGLSPGTAYYVHIRFYTATYSETLPFATLAAGNGGGGGGGDIPDPTDPPGAGDAWPPGNPYSPRRKRIVNGGACWDGRPRRFEVRAYRLVDGAWQRAYFPSKSVVEAQMVHRSAGGCASFTATVAVPVNSTVDIEPGMRVSLFVRESAGWREWWRGYFQAGTHEGGRPDRYTLTAYGAIERFRGIRVARQYAMAKADIATVFRRIIEDYAIPWYREAGIPLPALDIRKTGLLAGETREYTGNLTDVLSGMAGEATGLVWGVEVDAFGRECLYLRPLPEEVRYTAVYGRSVSSASWGVDASDVVNALTIEGGPPRYPNMVKNGSFEMPDNEGANLILNGGFEEVRQGKPKRAVNWTVTNGDPTVKSTETASRDDSLTAASGERYLELDNNGAREEVQSAPVGVSAGTRYVFRLVMAAEHSAHPVTPILRVLWLHADQSTLSTLVVSGPGEPLSWTPSDQSWQPYETIVTAPVSAAYAKISLGLPVGVAGRNRGIGIDDVVLAAADGVKQEGWQTRVNDTNRPTSTAVVDWQYGPGAVGAYAAQVDYATGNHAECFAGIAPDEIECSPNQEYRLTFYARAVSGGSVDVLLEYHDGEKWRPLADVGWLVAKGYTTGSGAIIPGGRRLALSADWDRYRVDIRTPGKARSIRIVFGGKGSNRSGGFALDGVYYHLGWPVDESGDPAMYPYMDAGAVVTYRMTTEDDWYQSPGHPIGRHGSDEARNSAYWHTGPNAGRVHHGVREDTVSVPTIKTAEDAMKWAASYFNSRAIEKKPSPVEVVDHMDNIRGNGLLRVLGVPGRDGLQLLPVQATHTFDRGGWRCEVERQDERADLAGLLAEIGRYSVLRHGVLVGSADALTRTVYTTPTALAGERTTEEFAGVNDANQLGLWLAHTPTGRLSVWVNGSKWRASLLSLDGQTLTVAAPDAGYKFTEHDFIEVEYEREA